VPKSGRRVSRAETDRGGYTIRIDSFLTALDKLSTRLEQDAEERRLAWEATERERKAQQERERLAALERSRLEALARVERDATGNSIARSATGVLCSTFASTSR
jgi:hypothetical protein